MTPGPAKRSPSPPRRRSLLAVTAGAMVSAMSSPCHATAQEAPPPLVIGVLTDPTGYGASVSGPPLVQAVRQAVQDTGLLPDGRPLSVIAASYQLKPADALEIAQGWFDQGVSVIVDVPGSAAAVAVQALAESRGRSYLATSTVNPDLTGRFCSRFGSSWSIDSVTVATALARMMARTGARTWFLVVPDTVLGQAMQSDATSAIGAAGGQVVGRARHPAPVSDFASVAAQARDSNARVIGLCDVTSALTGQLGQFQAVGLFGHGRDVVAFLPAIADIHAAGAEAAHGLLLATSFHWNQNEQRGHSRNCFSPPLGKCPMPRMPPRMSPFGTTCAPQSLPKPRAPA